MFPVHVISLNCIIDEKNKSIDRFSYILVLFGTSGFFQNSNCKCLLSDIFSIYLIGRPLVSGTHTGTNNNATTEITPNIRNVHDVPIACVKDRKDCATIWFYPVGSGCYASTDASIPQRVYFGIDKPWNCTRSWRKEYDIKSQAD